MEPMSTFGSFITWASYAVLLAFLAILFKPCRIRYSRYRRQRSLLKAIPTDQGNVIASCIGKIVTVLTHPLGPAVVIFQLLCGFAEIRRKEGITQFWVGMQPFVVLHSAETIEPLLSSNVNIAKAEQYDMMVAILGDGLLTSSGQKWRKRRKLLTPAFHFRVLEGYMKIFNEHSKVLVNKLGKSTHLDYVDVFPLMVHCSLDVLCESVMGLKLQSQGKCEHHYPQNLNSLLKMLAERLSRPWLWWDFAYCLSHQSKIFRKTAHQIRGFVRQVIQERKPRLDNAPDVNTKNEARFANTFLDLLVKQQLEDRSLTEEDIVEEVNTFLFAGHETTAIGMTYVLYLLGLHSDVQAKVVEELDSIFLGDSERAITKEDISSMKYLECVIKESQRLYTTVAAIGRTLEEDLDIGKYKVPRGCTCVVLSYMAHRDARHFPKPSEFNPDRFLPENCKGRHPYAFVPFSAGPRNCLGQKFAMMAEKVVVSSILRHFTLKSLDHRDQLILQPLPLLQPRSTQGGIRIRISSRRRLPCPS